MKTKTLSPDPITLVELSGRFDAHIAPDFVQWMDQQNQDSTQFLLVDMAEVNFIDSTALAALVRGLKRYRQNQGDLVLCNLKNPVQIIFELTRMDKAFQIYTSRETAVDYIKSQI